MRNSQGTKQITRARRRFGEPGDEATSTALKGLSLPAVTPRCDYNPAHLLPPLSSADGFRLLYLLPFLTCDHEPSCPFAHHAIHTTSWVLMRRLSQPPLISNIRMSSAKEDAHSFSLSPRPPFLQISSVWAIYGSLCGPAPLKIAQGNLLVRTRWYCIHTRLSTSFFFFFLDLNYHCNSLRTWCFFFRSRVTTDAHLGY